MPAAPENTARSGIQVIARTAEILRALNGEPNGLSLTELAAASTVPRSTVHRIVTALAREGLVVSVGPNGGYRLGPEILRLALTERITIRSEVRPFLDDLCIKSGETVDLGMRVRDQVYFVDQVISAVHPLRAVSAVGQSFPAWTNAAGKALLARMTDDQVRRLLPAKLPAFSPNSITDLDTLLQQLDEIRDTGISYAREEFTEGISAVGTTIEDNTGLVLSLSVPVPSQRFSKVEDKIAKLLMRTAKDINLALPAIED